MLAVKNITREHPTLVSEELEAIMQAFAEAGYSQMFKETGDVDTWNACIDYMEEALKGYLQ